MPRPGPEKKSKKPENTKKSARKFPKISAKSQKIPKNKKLELMSRFFGINVPVFWDLPGLPGATSRDKNKIDENHDTVFFVSPPGTSRDNLPGPPGTSRDINSKKHGPQIPRIPGIPFFGINVPVFFEFPGFLEFPAPYFRPSSRQIHSL